MTSKIGTKIVVTMHSQARSMPKMRLKPTLRIPGSFFHPSPPLHAKDFNRVNSTRVNPETVDGSPAVRPLPLGLTIKNYFSRLRTTI